MQIKLLEEKYFEKYTVFLLEFDESLFYYSLKYKNFLEEYLGCESQYLIAVDDNDDIQGILPLMSKEGEYGTVVNSLPFYGSNGGIISNSLESYELLLEHYYTISKEAASSTYITNPLFEDKVIEHDLIDIRIGQWTNLKYTEEIEEMIMKSFDSSARRNVRKAQKSGVEIHIDNTEIDFLYNTHYENITSIGGLAKDKRFFELISKYFEEDTDYNIYIATLNGEKIGAMLVFYFNKTVEYFTPAVVSEYRNYQALPCTIYQAMVENSIKGFHWWNWGGTWLIQDGVYKFKKKFGAVDKEYKYYIKINNSNIYNTSKEKIQLNYENFYVIPYDKLEGSNDEEK